MSTLTRIEHATSPGADPVSEVVRTWFGEEGEADVLSELLGWLGDTGDVPALCADAVAGYVCSQVCVEQEIVHPNGTTERGASLQSGLSRSDFEHPRFAYIVSSWYENLTARLPGMEADWDAWQSGDFRQVLRHENSGDIVCWWYAMYTECRDLSGLSRWRVKPRIPFA